MVLGICTMVRCSFTWHIKEKEIIYNVCTKMKKYIVLRGGVYLITPLPWWRSKMLVNNPINKIIHWRPCVHSSLNIFTLPDSYNWEKSEIDLYVWKCTERKKYNYIIHTYIHQHHVMPLAWISLTLSRHFSLSFIASGWSSGLHPVSSHSCCMYVWAGHPAFARTYVGVHRSTSLMSSSLLLLQYPACLANLTWIVFVMGGRWPYSWCLAGCCRQNISSNIEYIHNVCVCIYIYIYIYIYTHTHIHTYTHTDR